MICEENGYHLKLGNGLGWNIKAINGVGKWLDDLANIMRLEPASKDNLDKIIFCKMGGFHAAIEYYYRDTKDWFVYDNKSVRTWMNRTNSDVICEIDDDGSPDIGIVNMWNSLHPIYQRVQDGGGLPFHAALLELDGKGVILAAPGSTGKSTSCRRLPDYWNPLGDDEALVVYDPKNGYRAHPFPTWSEYLWKSPDKSCGKSWDVQYSVPVSAIFFLEQAESDEVIPLGDGMAAVSINQSATEVSRKFWRKLDDDIKRPLATLQFHNACGMAKTIPSFTLRQSLNGRFWEEIEETLNTISIEPIMSEPIPKQKKNPTLTPTLSLRERENTLPFKGRDRVGMG
ncbi:MAG: SynChlorMet cassette protein ScmC [Nitrospirae bacterium]|nr:SynChlorMet cassette protein ScmC [Nitrospirota bacterium]